jgi:hypothetical protein
VDVNTSLITDGEAAEVAQPSDGALHHPAVPPQSLARLDSTPGDSGGDAPAPQRSPHDGVIVPPVPVQLRGPRARPPALPCYWREAVEEREERLAVVCVGRRNGLVERESLPVHQEVVLAARLAAVRRVGPREMAPLFAPMDEASTEARSQSMRPAPCNSSRRHCWSCSQTPACCQSRRRRQHVMPLPQPICWGKSSH